MNFVKRSSPHYPPMSTKRESLFTLSQLQPHLLSQKKVQKQSEILFFIGPTGYAGDISLLVCKMASRLGHRCYVYTCPFLESSNRALSDKLNTIISLPNIERVFDSNLPNNVDLFVSAAASDDFKFQAWFLEVQDILRRMCVKQKLLIDPTGKDQVFSMNDWAIYSLLAPSVNHSSLVKSSFILEGCLYAAVYPDDVQKPPLKKLFNQIY